MAIRCVKCAYEMSGYEFLGHLVGDLYELWKSKITRGWLSDTTSKAMAGIADEIKIVCPICRQFESWLPVITELPVDQLPKGEHEL